MNYFLEMVRVNICCIYRFFYYGHSCVMWLVVMKDQTLLVVTLVGVRPRARTCFTRVDLQCFSQQSTDCRVECSLCRCMLGGARVEFPTQRLSPKPLQIKYHCQPFAIQINYQNLQVTKDFWRVRCVLSCMVISCQWCNSCKLRDCVALIGAMYMECSSGYSCRLHRLAG